LSPCESQKKSKVGKLVSLQRIVQEVSSAPDLPAASRIVVKRVRETMHTDVCSISLTEPATGTLVLSATEGLNPTTAFSVCRSSTVVRRRASLWFNKPRHADTGIRMLPFSLLWQRSWPVTHRSSWWLLPISRGSWPLFGPGHKLKSCHYERKGRQIHVTLARYARCKL